MRRGQYSNFASYAALSRLLFLRITLAFMRNSRVIFMAAWLVAGVAVLNATTVVSASCDIRVDGPDGTVEHLSQSGSSCALVSPMFGGNGTSASASAFSSLTSSLMKIDVASIIGAFTPAVDVGLSAFSSATLDVTVDFLLATPGPARSGFLQLSVPPSDIGSFTPGGDRPHVMLSTVQIGNLLITCPAEFSFSCVSPDFVAGSSIAPFPLGQAFEFRSEMQMQAIGIFPVEAESAVGFLNFGFSMLDTDQSTPVALVQVPEASSLALLLLAAPMLWGLRRFQSRSELTQPLRSRYFEAM